MNSTEAMLEQSQYSCWRIEECRNHVNGSALERLVGRLWLACARLDRAVALAINLVLHFVGEAGVVLLVVALGANL